MFKRLADWFDDRTSYRKLVHEALAEPIPGGARVRYVFGSALTATFVIQLVTGLLLMTSYSPSATTAWGSVYYISFQMTGGWFIRGLHHFGSQAMIVLLALHLLQVLVAGAYRAPREVNWWFGMILLFVTLAFSLTGYLLPWDQKGYWATKVATNIMGGAPVVGPYVSKVVVGGADYGNQTLTRFYALHVGVLPLALIVALVAHVALFRKHGVTHPRETRGVVDTFWPKQVFLDTLVAAIVLALMVFLIWWEGGWANGGADLDAPADAASGDYPARPEWYFLSLFQMLKLFPGKYEVVGTMVVPTAILAVLFLLPLFDRVLPGKLAHFLACAIVFGLVGGAGYLTYEAMRADRADAQFQADRRAASETAERARLLAGDPNAGIAPDGAGFLLERDPLTHGRAVLDSICLSCHAYDGKPGAGATQTASDLKGYGTKEWLRGLLDAPNSAAHLGKVKGAGGMKRWKEKTTLTAAELDAIADFFAEHVIPTPRDMAAGEWEEQEAVKNHPGYKAFNKEGECATCHMAWDAANEEAPNLFAWGSADWTSRMIRRPASPLHYGFLDEDKQMPPFADRVSENDLNMLIRLFRGDYVGANTAPSPEKTAAPK